MIGYAPFLGQVPLVIHPGQPNLGQTMAPPAPSPPPAPAPAPAKIPWGWIVGGGVVVAGILAWNIFGHPKRDWKELLQAFNI